MFGSSARFPHLKDYLRVLSGRRFQLVGISLLVVLATAAWVSLTTPFYRSSTLLLIEPAKVNLTGFQNVDQTMANLGGEMSHKVFLETQYSLITSRPLLRRAFQEFGFAQTSEFESARDPLAAFEKLFWVEPIRNTRLAYVHFTWRDAERTAKVLDFVINEYLDDYRARSLGVTQGGLSALRAKADELRPEVEKRSSDLQDFKVRHTMVSLEDSQNIIVERLKSISDQLVKADQKEIQYQSIADSIRRALRDKTALENLPEVAENQPIHELKREYIRARQDYIDMTGRFGPNHPDIKATRSRMSTLEEKIQQEMRAVLASSEAELDRLKRQASALRSELNSQETRVLEYNNLAGQYLLIKQSFETLSKTYNAIIQRIDEIEIAMAAGSKDENVFVIQRAEVPRRHWRPRKMFSLALAGVLGPLAGILFCFFVEYLDTTVKSKEQVEEILQLPVIGMVPPAEPRKVKEQQAGDTPPELLSVEDPRTPVAEAFRSIRTSLAFARPAHKNFLQLLVTSGSPREGKTLTSVNLAIALARAGRRTLLVDADMRKPRLHNLFGCPLSPGLSNLIAHGDLGFERAVVPIPLVPNLFLLPAGTLPPQPAELLASGRMKDLIQAIESFEGAFDTFDAVSGHEPSVSAPGGDKFEVVLFDTPPIATVADAGALAPIVDFAILVVRCFRTERDTAKHAASLIQQSGGKVFGVVLNNADVPKHTYYGYGGYYGSHYYYGDDAGNSGPKKRRSRKNASAEGVGAASRQS